METKDPYQLSAEVEQKIKSIQTMLNDTNTKYRDILWDADKNDDPVSLYAINKIAKNLYKVYFANLILSHDIDEI